MDVFIVLGVLFTGIALGLPIAYALALSALAGALWIGIPVEAVMLQISSGVSKFAMLTIPFFVLAGAIMAEGGMARRLVAFANMMIGIVRVRGGLSLVNIMATTFMSGISGSSVADVSAIGSVMIPQMEKSGYPRVFATNVTIAASVQGLLVPPSHNAVIYSLATGGTISIASLFMAGVMPGLLLGASLMLLCLVIAYRDSHPTGEAVPLRQAFKVVLDAFWGLITLVIILGGILGGVFTAIEAGAVACVYAFFVTMFVYRDYRWKDLPLLVYRTLRTVSMVMMLIACAASVGYMMALMQMPAKITAFFLTLVEQQVRDPDDDQRTAAGAWLPRRHGALDPDHHADPLARRHKVRRRPGAFRDDHAAQPGDRAVPSAGWRDPLCRLCRRQGAHGRRHAQNLAVLRRDVRRADAGDLCSSDIAMVAPSAAAVTQQFRIPR